MELMFWYEKPLSTKADEANELINIADEKTCSLG